MKGTLLIISILAICWHLAIFWISQSMGFRRDYSPLRRTLDLVELELLKSLQKKLKKLPPRKINSSPYSSWVEETRNWIRRIEENRQ